MVNGEDLICRKAAGLERYLCTDDAAHLSMDCEGKSWMHSARDSSLRIWLVYERTDAMLLLRAERHVLNREIVLYGT